MEESKRTTKSVVIALIFFLILGLIAFLIYRAASPPLEAIPNPTINLSPVQVVSTQLFNIENNDYDFLAKVANPNTDYGSPDVVYELTFFNSADKQISQRVGSFYILPGQTKYIIETPLRFDEPVSRAEMKVKSVDWQKLDPLATRGTNLLIRNSAYAQVSRPELFSKVGGDILNNSDFDFGKVDVVVVAVDENSTPLVVNRTEIRTFLARTSRGFEVKWFKPFTGQVNRVIVEANTNLFENSNFLRTYGGGEKFKQLY